MSHDLSLAKIKKMKPPALEEYFLANARYNFKALRIQNRYMIRAGSSVLFAKTTDALMIKFMDRVKHG